MSTMAGVGPAPGSSSSSKGGGGGGGGGDGGSYYCLLCYSPEANANSMELLPPLDPDYGIKVNSNSWVFFMLRKLLLFTPEECEYQLVSRGGVLEPAQWFQICRECVGWLQDFRAAERGMMEGLPGAEERVNSMRRQVRDKLRTMVNANNGDRSQDDILDLLEREVEEEEEVVNPADGDDGEANNSLFQVVNFPNPPSNEESSPAGHSSSSTPSSESDREWIGSNGDSSLESSDVLRTSTTGRGKGNKDDVPHDPQVEDGGETIHLNKALNMGNNLADAAGTTAGNIANTCSTRKKTPGRKCESCGKSFRFKSDLADHLLSHSRERPFGCPKCTKRFLHQRDLVEHLRGQHAQEAEEKSGSSWECVFCSQRFSYKSWYFEHLRGHTREKAYLCKDCTKEFTRPNSLTTHHVRFHSKKKRHVCLVCNKEFGRAGHLVEHRRLHTGERPFGCQHCPKKFNKANDLTRHLRIHTGEKPFRCQDCKKSFRRKDGLSVHAAIHMDDKPFECPHCQEKYKRRDDLTAPLCASHPH